MLRELIYTFYSDERIYLEYLRGIVKLAEENDRELLWAVTRYIVKRRPAVKERIFKFLKDNTYGKEFVS